MGLDWHTYVKVETSDEPEYKKPCEKVGAPKFRDRSTFQTDVEEYVNRQKTRAEEEAKRDHPNWRFVEYWRKRTLEEELADTADKFDCENCPLLKELQGADSSKSFFLGVTVTSCDFRGKRISADDEISEELRHEAYDEHDPAEMEAFADRLEIELERLRNNGLLKKDPYEVYSAEYDADPWPLKDPKMTPEEYAVSPHWRERNLREAIHWLRTCAKHGVSMTTSY